ncbi:DUF3857 domain-containing protein [Phenylobacterium sp. LjRoot225]|uniref:DUF3857 domain-containing protein n=1 Tax=Phenylobacterium sp. LjRoot225 TaxID=3342285 RepID=UPI003ECC33F7
MQVAPIPEAPRQNDIAVQTLLDDNQSWLGPDGDVAYNRRVQKIIKPEGLDGFTTFSVSWDPQTEEMAIHHLRIIRDGKTIDLLQHGKKMLVLRREQDLESSILDGRMTASQQLDGLQVGDIVDSSWTETRRDPIARGHSYDMEGLGFAGRAARYRVRLSWPDGAPVVSQASPGFGATAISHHDGRTWLEVDMTDVAMPHPPVGAPPRFQRVGVLETSGWSSSADISRAMWPHYAKAVSLKPGSPLKVEAAAIAAGHPDEAGRAGAALALVEDKTRYFLLAIGQGGYVPASADDTWRRKFGDCKGKSVLLLALLNELGISAEPVLVNTRYGDGLDERLPSLGAFDHVIIKATIGGRTYWLDATRSGDRSGLDHLKPPPYRWALPLRAEGASLLAIPDVTLDAPQMEMTFSVDARRGLDAPAPAKISIRVTGDAATAMRATFTNTPKAEMERGFKQQMSASMTWFHPEAVSWKDDAAHDAAAVEVSGMADLNWRLNPDAQAREFKVSSTSGMRGGYPKREPGPNQDAPFAMPFPLYARYETRIRLPDGGKGFTIRGPNGDGRLPGYRLNRNSQLEGDTAVFSAEMQSLAREISASDAAEANKALRRLADDESFVRAPR